MDALPPVNTSLEQSIGDIQPEAFRERLHVILGERPLTPAVLTVRTGRALDATTDVTTLADRGVAVQLVYIGLSRYRSLIRRDSWLDRDGAGTADLDMVAAEVFVSRGTNILADTAVIGQVIELIRRFGRNQAYEQSGETESLESSLEADVITLAVNAGADVALSTIPPAIESYASSLAERIDTDPMTEPAELDGIHQEISQLHNLHETPVARERSSSSTVDP